MKTINQFKKNTEFVKIFNKLFSVRHNAHLHHLRSNSHAEHETLGEFYEKLLNLADELIETYQGKYGKVSDLTVEKESNSISVIIRKLAEEIEAVSVEDSFLQNILDEIVALCYRTLYKLSMN